VTWTNEHSLRMPRGIALGTLGVFIALAIVGACSSPSTRIGRLYESLQSDVSGRVTGSIPDPKIAERHAARAAEVRKMVEQGELQTAKERFEAAVILVENDELDDLKLAEVLAQEAAIGGERLAPRVAAEAIDKQRVLAHQPQRYGTQYEWVPALGQWRLYVLDPSTTDSERQAVGVPPLAEIYEIEKKLNAGYAAR
jgi:hypothetical protein